jgi:putative ABC transport system permease protein
MRAVLLAQVRANAARLIASTLAIVIAVAFVVATLVLNETTHATMLRAIGAQYVGADAAISSADGSSLAADADVVGGVPGVAAVAPAWEVSAQAVLPGRTGPQYVLAEGIADAPALRWQQVTAGELPDGPGQIALTTDTDAGVGDVVRVTVTAPDGTATTSDATVVGLVDLGGDPTASLYARAFVTTAQALAWGATDPTELRIAADGASSGDLLSRLSTALAGRDLLVQSGIEAAEAQVASITGNAMALTAVLLVFATVAVLVAGLVIANTFAVLLAQRTRELALLRCVGATTRQIRRSVLGEAMITGVAASALGVLGGVGLAAGVSALVGSDSPVPLSGVSVPWYAVVTGLAVGTVVTLLAALAPARAATRVSPLSALRPTDPARLTSRTGVLRLVLGVALLLPGVGLMAVGSGTGQVLVSLPGGVLSCLGVLLLAQRAIPPVVATAGRLVSRLGGVPARLAAGNATRNPRRTAATATALLIGVTLTTAMVVGAASTRATATAGLAAAYPTDVLVESSDGGGVPGQVIGRIGTLPDVRADAEISTAELTGPDGLPVQVQAVDPAAAAGVLRSTSSVQLPVPGEVVLPPHQADGWAVADGDPVQLTGPDGSVTLTARIGSPDVVQPRLTTADLATVSPDPVVSVLWLRLADGDAVQREAVAAVTDLAGTSPTPLQVTGLASERAAIDQVLDVLLLVVTALLGVAVLIALIGVGNTLALSVVERRQESGLLRALGLTRRQLRGLLAWEAVLVAGVAAVLGVLLGSAYGLVGVMSVLGDLGEIVVSVPWLQLGAIVVVATLAGLLASVLPASRAARTSPVAAIAG